MLKTEDKCWLSRLSSGFRHKSRAEDKTAGVNMMPRTTSVHSQGSGR